MSADNAHYVRAGKCGLMDMLAGGHVDDVTFGQAIELLRAEDWEALRLLLAGETLYLQHSTLRHLQHLSHRQKQGCCQPDAATFVIWLW